MAKDLAIILSNGSVNSAVATGLAAQRYRTILLHAEVAPQQASRMRIAYEQQVAHYKPYREHTLPMHYLSAVMGSNRPSMAGADPRMGAPIGPQMLELLPLVASAARFAVHYQATAIYVGMRVGGHGDELAQATEFVQIWNEMLNLPCGQPELELITPLLELEPWQVVDVGFQAAVPFEKTWSCLEEGGEPCWACRGCRAREAAFQQAGKPDPLRTARRM